MLDMQAKATSPLDMMDYALGKRMLLKIRRTSTILSNIVISHVLC